MSFKRVMVDIETMDVHEANSLVLTVGAVEFAVTVSGPVFGKNRFWRMNLLEQLVLGRTTSRETQLWWGRQSEEAKEDLERDVSWCVVDFANSIEAFVRDREVWANGICFDLCNLVQMCSSQTGRRPWPYNAARDARTFYRALPKTREVSHDDDLVAHSAIEDCVSQVWQLWAHWPERGIFDEVVS